MKKAIIILIALTFLSATSYAQEDSEKKESKQSSTAANTSPTSPIMGNTQVATKGSENIIWETAKETAKGVVDAVMSGEALESEKKFAYGLLKQACNTIVGIGESLLELPKNTVQAGKESVEELRNTPKTVYYYGKYSIKAIGNTIAKIYDNITSGDPERIGEATFDVGFTIATINTWKLGKHMANKYGSSYHYTLRKYVPDITEGGLKVIKTQDKTIFATYDGTLSGAQAKAQLALNKTPDVIIKIHRSVKADEIRQVKPKYGQPGGGTEKLFRNDIPSGKIIEVIPIQENPSAASIKMRRAGEVANIYTGVITPFTAEPLITERIAADNMNNTDGGHTIDARINIIAFAEDSIEQGMTMLFEMEGVFYLGINPVDMEKITPEFLSNISMGKSEYTGTEHKRNREEVVPPSTRHQRGL